MALDDTLAHYTFVPWMRRGIASEIDAVDDLGENPNAGETGRATISVELVIDYTPITGGEVGDKPSVSKQVKIVGPGDIKGIKKDAIVRTFPYDNAVKISEHALGYIEFYEEDFPWRYTPANVAAGHKLRPWISLCILKADEFEGPTQPPVGPSFIKLTGKENSDRVLPFHKETWAWAHVHVNRPIENTSDVTVAIDEDPDCAVSRLLCPRHLEPETAYHAFLVPAFETGRLAGLGELETIPDIPAQKPSWTTGDMQNHTTVRPNEYPAYYHWKFKTGTGGDFEDLVRALLPGPAGPQFGKRPMDISQPGYGLDGIANCETVEIEGTLKPPDLVREPFPDSPGQDFIQTLEGILDLTENLQRQEEYHSTNPFYEDGAIDGFAEDIPDDPILTPPIYGKWYTGAATENGTPVRRIMDTADEPTLQWLRELNLDPRYRAVAGLGTQVIQKRQEELMERAWQQLGNIEDANQRLREAELATALNESVFKKHFRGASDDRVLTLTTAVQRRILRASSEKTVHGEIRASRVTTAAKAPALKRTLQRKTLRTFIGPRGVSGFHQHLFERLNEEPDVALSAARPKSEPETAMAMETVSSAMTASLSEYADEVMKPRQVFLELLHLDLSTRRQNGEDLDTLALNTLKDSLKNSLGERISDTASTEELQVKGEVQNLIDNIETLSADGTEAATVRIPANNFETAFGSEIAGKSYRGVTVRRTVDGAVTEIARTTDLSDIHQFQSDLAAFNTAVVQERPLPSALPRIENLDELAHDVLLSLRPKHRVVERLAQAVNGVPERAEDDPRPLRPVMAHPVFHDPMLDDLRKISQDWVIPNFSDIPKNTITLLESNQAFIEAYLGGINNEMARELLWREYPTDLRGTYFQHLFDTRDSLSDTNSKGDIRKMHLWSGKLGEQSPREGSYLVLVIRGELLQKYPNTVVYANKAKFQGGDRNAARRLADDAVSENVCFPSFHAELEPDIALFGFALSPEEARGKREAGEPGWFFVLKERPGQINFALDKPPSPLPDSLLELKSWNDLHWGYLQYPDSYVNHIPIDYNDLTLDGTGDNSLPIAAEWGRTAADMAYIFYQNPVLYARHAEEMLP